MSKELVVRPQAGAVTRQGFGSQEMTIAAETQTAAMAARARAEVEARYIMALRHPRDWDAVRQVLLEECRRYSFAEVARYKKPGLNVRGPSIRFAEAAARAMRNIEPVTEIVYEDDDKRIVRVRVTDLETNLSYRVERTITRTVERHRAEGREVIGERLNSKNKPVYIVVATDDEMLTKQAAWESKALRSGILRLMPGDLLEECMKAAEETVKQQVKTDPNAVRKRHLDKFSELGVTPAELREWLGHDLAKCTEDDHVALVALWNALNEKACTWQEAMQQRRIERGEEEPKTAMGKGVQAVAARLKAAKSAEKRSGQRRPADKQ